MRSRRMAAELIGILSVIIILSPVVAKAEELKPLSISMESYEYPYPVDFLPLTIEGQYLRMAYMSVPAEGKDSGRTVLLLHGKNFFGAYWKDTIRFLTRNGFRVIVPDQLGFGKSAKPDIHYSFHLLAANTKKLLDTLGIKEVAVVGHSMGGMLATRFALMYPDMVSHLVLEDPIGLEDYRTFVPYASLEQLYQSEFNATEEGIRNYHKAYYVQWKPEYEEYPNVAIRWKKSGEYSRLAMSSALTYQMIYEQPICYEFSNLKAKTLLVIGQADRTVVGKSRVKKELLSSVGQFPELGRKTAKLIPGSTFVELPNVGHIPHFEATERFHQELLSFFNDTRIIGLVTEDSRKKSPDSSAPVAIIDRTAKIKIGDWMAMPVKLASNGKLAVTVDVVNGNPIEVYVISGTEMENYKNHNKIKNVPGFTPARTRNYKQSADVVSGEYYLILKDSSTGVFSKQSSDIKVNIHLQP